MPKDFVAGVSCHGIESAIPTVALFLCNKGDMCAHKHVIMYLAKIEGSHPSLAYTRGMSGSVASATANVCLSDDNTCVSCGAAANCIQHESVQ